jgi:ribonuclease Z
VALGTGMPTVRPKQAAASFLVELGNGDKFLFDVGYGSIERLSAMKIPMDYLDKVFIGHLHMDHFGDLDALWIGGVKMNRTFPLRVWGPSGATPEMGTAYAIDGLKRMLNWDAVTLKGLLDTRGEQIEVTEFDYKGVNQVIYEANGVTIRSIPAIHTADGAVSFILDWNGLTFAYSSDTFPNKWWIEHTKGADLSVHECFASPQILLDKQKYPPDFALSLSVFKHTSPQQFGKVMAMTQPRLAVGYHFYNDHDTLPVMLEHGRGRHGDLADRPDPSEETRSGRRRHVLRVHEERQGADVGADQTDLRGLQREKRDQHLGAKVEPSGRPGGRSDLPPLWGLPEAPHARAYSKESS